MSETISLKDAEVGNTYIVKKIGGAGPVKRRIMDMGLTKRTKLYIRKVAPMGDPLQINLRNYELTLRRADAEFIEVEKLAEDEEE